MSEPHIIVEALFIRIRRQPRFQLGIGELQAALDAVIGGWGSQNEADLHQVLCLLWCHSRESRRDFDACWEELKKELNTQSSLAEKKIADNSENAETNDKDTQSIDEESTTVEQSTPSEQTTTNNLGILLTQSPPLLTRNEEEIWSNLPVSRRSMAYGWRTLRRFKADGILDVVDVPKTINQVARQGFYVAPILQRRLVNHARLLLLIDREGSMVPFHRFNQDLVQTAQEDYDVESIQVAYFHNVPHEYVYEDERMVKPIELRLLLEWCDKETSVMIVGDAGAARGTRQLQRIKATTKALALKALALIRSHTNMLAWLNPVPEERWEGTTAELLAYAVPMKAMTENGFKRMINLVRG
jgi:uncharacterized protein